MGVAELLNRTPWWARVVGALLIIVALVMHVQSPPLAPPADGLETLIKTARAMRQHPLPARPRQLRAVPVRTPRDADHVLRWLRAAYGTRAQPAVEAQPWYLAARSFMQCQDQRRPFAHNATQWLADAAEAAAAPLYHPDAQTHRRRLARRFGHHGPTAWAGSYSSGTHPARSTEVGSAGRMVMRTPSHTSST